MGDTASSCSPFSDDSYTRRKQKLYDNEEKDTTISKLSDKWIFYHIPIKCRGNFVRLVLIEAGVDWIDAYGFINIDRVFISAAYKDSAKNPRHDGYPNNDISIPDASNVANIPNEERIYDVMGSPCIVNYANPLICLGQTPMIVQFIADKYGLRPKSDIDHYLAGMIVTNCNDFFDLLGRVSREVKMDKEKLLEFMNGKFRIWLNMIAKPLGDRLYYFDDRITQSDLALYNILDCLYETFDSNEKLLHEFVWKLHPNLKPFYKNIVKKAKSIAPLMKKQKEAGMTWWPYMAPWPYVKEMIKTLSQYADDDL